MDTMTEKLEALKAVLAGLPGFTTCKIGLEPNISPDDWPIVRVVPSNARRAEYLDKRRLEVLIYFGHPVDQFDDTPDGSGRVRLEKLYATMMATEKAIIEAIEPKMWEYQETIFDEDRLETYKMAAIRARALLDTVTY